VRWSLGQLAERALVRRKRPALRACKLAGTAALRSDRSDDQPFPVRRDVKLGVGGDPKQLENRLSMMIPELFPTA
jgi:hypothetical protein